AGLGLGIVNAGQLVGYADIPKDVLGMVEDVIFDRRPDATERLVDFAKSVSGAGQKREVDLRWREGSVEERLKHAVLHGEVAYIEEDAEEARVKYGKPLLVIEGPLMDGMQLVGDLFGLSGLITPSLDEMVVVAKEMTRRDFRIPLLIGGATTSKQHTAVRIAPAYDGTTVHVLDASRVIGVVSDLLDDGRRGKFESENAALQEKLRAQHTSSRRPLLTLAESRARRLLLPFGELPQPPFVGRKVIEPELAQLREYVDWTFFFHAWELKGKYPAILDSPSQGAAARELFGHAQELLDEIQANRWLQA